MPLRYKIVNFFVKRKKAIVGGLSQAVAEGLLLWRNVGVRLGKMGVQVGEIGMRGQIRCECRLDKIKIGVPGGKSGKMPHIKSVIVADFSYFQRQGKIVLGAMIASNLQLWLVG